MFNVQSSMFVNKLKIRHTSRIEIYEEHRIIDVGIYRRRHRLQRVVNTALYNHSW